MSRQNKKWNALFLALVLPVAVMSVFFTTCAEDESSSDTANSDGDGGEDDTETETDAFESLSIEPGDVTLVVVDGAVQQQAYTVTGIREDGSEEDLTGEVFFTITNSSLGSFSGNVLTTSDRFGGETEVTAQVDDLTVKADLTVRVESVFIGDGVPADPQDLFTGTEDATRAPGITYPADGVLLPPNLADVGFFWDGGTGNDVWRVRFEGEFSSVDVYVAAVSYVPEDLIWGQLIPGNGGLDAVEVTVAGTAALDPSTYGESEPINYSVAQEAVEGGVYYWAANSTVSAEYGIFRFDFGTPGQAAGQVYTTAQTEDRCVACHALRHDGTAMVVNYDGGNGPADLISVAAQDSILDDSNAYYANFQTFSPDDAYLLSVYQGIFTLRDGDTAAAIEALADEYITYPDWSPLGDMVAFTRCTRPTEGFSDWTFRGGQIEVMSFGGPGSWGTPEIIVPAETADVNYYYPAISPDGDWIIYNRSTESGGYSGAGDSYSDDDATLHVIGVDGQNGRALDAVNLTGNLRTSWAKWCPTVYEYQGEPVMWFTFSSMRRYGDLLADGENPQLWMSAFSPDRATEGDDPAWPAFYLPFQDISTNNHIAQWTEVVVDIQ